MSIQQLTALTMAYIEADSSNCHQCQRALENYLESAGNTAEQVRFWLGFCVELTGDEDGDLLSGVTTETTLAVLQGVIQV